jgi:CheY-like chemotaxis protein
MRRRLRVLIVDDNQDLVDTMADLLETEGHVVKGIYSASTIAPDCIDFQPDVVLMDIRMPGRDGWAAALEIRSLPWEKPLTLIAVSGQYPQGVAKDWLKASGFDYFLIKPADPNVLLQLVRAHADHARK